MADGRTDRQIRFSRPRAARLRIIKLIDRSAPPLSLRRGGGDLIVAVDRVIKRGRNRPSCRITRLLRPRFTIRLVDRSDFRSRPALSLPPPLQAYFARTP